MQVEKENAIYDFLYRIVYSLSYGEAPKVQISNSIFEMSDLFSGYHLKDHYKNYIFSKLGSNFQQCSDQDLKNISHLLQGIGDYFKLRTSENTYKYFFITPRQNFIYELTPNLRQIFVNENSSQFVIPRPQLTSQSIDLNEYFQSKLNSKMWNDIYK